MKRLVLEAASSHLYPGSIFGVPAGPAGTLRRGRALRCLVVFADGSSAAARLRRSGTHLVLAVERYTTARGTEIGPKAWRLLQLPRAPGPLQFRVQGRVG